MPTLEYPYRASTIRSYLYFRLSIEKAYFPVDARLKHADVSYNCFFLHFLRFLLRFHVPPYFKRRYKKPIVSIFQEPTTTLPTILPALQPFAPTLFSPLVSSTFTLRSSFPPHSTPPPATACPSAIHAFGRRVHIYHPDKSLHWLPTMQAQYIIAIRTGTMETLLNDGNKAQVKEKWD